jgi:hypothetical protein
MLSTNPSALQIRTISFVAGLLFGCKVSGLIRVDRETPPFFKGKGVTHFLMRRCGADPGRFLRRDEQTPTLGQACPS